MFESWKCFFVLAEITCIYIGLTIVGYSSLSKQIGDLRNSLSLGVVHESLLL